MNCTMRSALFLVFLVSSVISRRPPRSKPTRRKAPVVKRPPPQINQIKKVDIVDPLKSHTPATRPSSSAWSPPARSWGTPREPSKELAQNTETRLVTNRYHRALPRQRSEVSTNTKTVRDSNARSNQRSYNTREDLSNNNGNSFDNTISEISKAIEEKPNADKRFTDDISNPESNESYTVPDANRNPITRYKKGTGRDSKRDHYDQNKNNLIEDHEPRDRNQGKPLHHVNTDTRDPPRYDIYKDQKEHNEKNSGIDPLKNNRQMDAGLKDTNHDANHNNHDSNKVPNNFPSMGYGRNTHKRIDNYNLDFQKPEMSPGMNYHTDSDISPKRDGDLNSRDRVLDSYHEEAKSNSSPNPNTEPSRLSKLIKGAGDISGNAKSISDLVSNFLPEKTIKDEQTVYDSSERDSSNLREESPSSPQTTDHNSDFLDISDRIQSNSNYNDIVRGQDGFHQTTNDNAHPNREPNVIPSSTGNYDSIPTNSNDNGSYPGMAKVNDPVNLESPPFDMTKNIQPGLMGEFNSNNNRPELTKGPDPNSNQPHPIAIHD